MEKIYKPIECASIVGVSVITLHRWANEGKLVAYRNPKGRRYYTETQDLEYRGIPKENKVGKTIIYARVSNRNQKKDLENQIEFLRNFANSKGWIVDEILNDIGSGLNYKRKKWNELLDWVQKREIKTVLISHKDRFVRFGFEWFEGLLQKCGVEMVIVNNETDSPKRRTRLGLNFNYSCSFLSYLCLRKYKKKLKEVNEL
nr:IS607 family transposase [Neobacillus drentensis]